MVSSSLRARLARVERLVVAAADRGAPTPDLFVAVAVAISMGGFPRAVEHPWKQHADSYGDAYARALGFADREALVLAIVTDNREDYRRRVRQALAALCAPDGLGPDELTDDRVLRACAATLAAASAGTVPDRVGAALKTAAKARGVALN